MFKSQSSLASRFSITIVVCLIALLTGCESSNALDSKIATQTTPTSNDGVECKMERTIGSNLKTRVCRSAAERAALEESSQAYFLSIPNSGGTSHSGG